MRRAWSDGTTSVVFDPVVLEVVKAGMSRRSQQADVALTAGLTVLIGKLVALIPPRHFNLVSYAGVFASRSSLRAEVVPAPRPDDKVYRKVCEHPSPSSRWLSWARMLDLVLEHQSQCTPYRGCITPDPGHPPLPPPVGPDVPQGR